MRCKGLLPFLWFDDRAEEAVGFYSSIFEDSKVLTVTRYGEGGPGPAGSVMTMTFELQGREFVALNGGPHFQFNEAVSFFVNCENQEEIDYYWQRLGEGGQYLQCGWLKDKFGVTWQVVPTVLPQLIGDADAAKSRRTVAAMMGMIKLDFAELRRAHGGL